ncbi:hypothetical protein V8G54_036511, partial [Vigna mungo]
MGNLQFGSYIKSGEDLSLSCCFDLWAATGGYRLGRTLAVLSTITLGTSMAVRHYRDKATGRTEEEVVFLYEEWLVKHGKLYNTLEEKDKRFQIFKDNLRYIDEVNSANLTYWAGLNQFADLTYEEFSATHLGLDRTPSNRYTPCVGDAFPDSVDWRKEGVLVPVKDQGSCDQDYKSTMMVRDLCSSLYLLYTALEWLLYVVSVSWRSRSVTVLQLMLVLP